MLNRYQTKAKVVLGRPVRAHQGRRSAKPARRAGQAKLDRRTLDRLLCNASHCILTTFLSSVSTLLDVSRPEKV